MKNISFILGIIVLLFLAVGTIISTVYEKEVKSYLLQQVNNSINTKIDVKEINFSVLKKFPYASLALQKITAEEVTESIDKGILFSADAIYLQFNVLDLLKKNYNIKKISIENAIVNIRIDEKGNDNYHFLKKSEDNSSVTMLNVALENLSFKEVTFYLSNQYKNLDMAIEAIDLSLAGKLSENHFTLHTQSELFVHQINNKEQSLLKDKSIYINTSLAVDQSTQTYSIKQGKISLADLTFNLSGRLKNKEEGINLQLQSKGSGLKIPSLLTWLPEKQKQTLNAYEINGNINYLCNIIGDYSHKKNPSVSINFQLKEGKIEEKSSNKALTHLNVSGNYTNGSENNFHSSQINLHQFSADFGPGHITGQYSITDFSNPYLQFSSQATIDLAEAKDFLKLDTLEMIKGQLHMDLAYQGYINKLSNMQAKDIKQLQAKGSAKIENVAFKLTDYQQKIDAINGVFRFNNNDIYIDTMNFEMIHSKIKLRGKANNLLPHLLIKDEYLTLQANMNSSKLTLDDFLINHKKEENDTSYRLQLSKHIQLSLYSKIDTFLFRKFKAHHLKGTIQLNNGILTAKDVSLNALEGNIKGNFTIDDTPQHEVLITSKVHLANIDINQLFEQCENFGQNYMLAQNIKGKATTAIDFASVWDKQLNINKEKIHVLADVAIHHGQLINYQPILALSKFIKVQELEKIQFSSLNTTIKIKDQTVFMPETDIQSSALNLTLSGTHTFDNQINYRFKLLMNDVLWGKAKQKKKENLEFGYVKDDGLKGASLFLTMKGTVNNYKLRYDTKGLKENWKKEIKKEKKTLKQILNKEFGWFKKEATTKEKPKEDDGLQIEWEENKDKKSNTTTKEGPKKEKKGLGKWIDKIAKPNAEEYEKSDDF